MMPKSFAKRCCKCGQPVRVTKHEWKWTRKFVPTAESADLGKAICLGCHEPLPVTVLDPYSMWEVTEKGFRHTLVDASKS